MSMRVAIRLALILGGLNLLLWLAGVLWLIHQVATGTPPYLYWQESALNALVFTAVGTIVAARRPEHPIGWLLLAAGLACAMQFLSGEYAASTLVLGPERLPYGPTVEWLSYVLQIVIVFLLFFLLLLFPTGRLLSSRWRIVAWMEGCGWLLGFTYTAVRPGPFEENSLFDNPFGVDAAILGPVNGVGFTLILAALLGALLSLVVRFVRSHGEERQQITWFVSVAVLGFFGLFSVTVSSNVVPGGAVDFLGNLLWAIVPASLPIAVGIAILRYHLYDIDLIINRALVYGLLTLVLAMVYFGGVTATQALFHTLAGQERLPQLVVVVSTLLIAALFNPLRRRIHSFIDRRFYRSKYDATRTLESFSAKLRNETDLGTLADDLVGWSGRRCNPSISLCGYAPIRNPTLRAPPSDGSGRARKPSPSLIHQRVCKGPRRKCVMVRYAQATERIVHLGDAPGFYMRDAS
jgi:hypothetical protein